MIKSFIFLIIYVLLWLIVFLRHQKRNGVWGAGSILIISYLLYGVFAIVYYSQSMYSYGELTLFPLLYLFAALFCASRPVLSYDNSRRLSIVPPRQFLLTSFTWFLIFVALLQIPRIISTIVSGITIILTDSLGGLALYQENSGAGLSDGSISNIFAIFYNVLSPFSILLLFYYLSLDRKRILIIVGLSLCVLIELLSQLSKGMRTQTSLTLLTLVITYFAFVKYYEEKIKKILRRIMLVVVILITVPFIALTVSRFDTKQGLTSSLLAYTGMSVLNFDKFCLDAGGVRNGDVTAPMFKRMLGFDAPQDFWEARAKHSNLAVDDSVFYTFIGDFTLDYGPIFAFVIFFFSGFLFTKWTRPKQNSIKLPFHKLIPLYFVMCICIQGGMYLFPFSYGRNLLIISFFLVYFVFYLDYKWSIKSKIKK